MREIRGCLKSARLAAKGEGGERRMPRRVRRCIHTAANLLINSVGNVNNAANNVNYAPAADRPLQLIGWRARARARLYAVINCAACVSARLAPATLHFRLRGVELDRPIRCATKPSRPRSTPATLHRLPPNRVLLGFHLAEFQTRPLLPLLPSLWYDRSFSIRSF